MEAGKTTVTQELLDANPALVNAGIKVGDEIENISSEEAEKLIAGKDPVQNEVVSTEGVVLTEEEKAKILEDAAKEPAPTTQGVEAIDESELDDFSKALKVRVDAGEKLTRADLVRPQGWTAAADTRFLPGLTEEEKSLHGRLALKIGQKVSSVTENIDGSYNVVGADQSTYTNVKL